MDNKFRLARTIRPNARLWYNGLFYDEAEQLAAIRLVKEGLADAIGIQMHHNLYTDESVYVPLLIWLEANEVPWRITELDVGIPPPTLAVLGLQADAYGRAVELCALYGCEAITVWGVADGVSNWLTWSYPLPFDGDYKPKPAWRVLFGGE
jgi:GH35 family endo-1,4-beta-xylanase